MKKIDIDELKKNQINILDKVHAFCLAKNITYFLSSGTLLGAVRHGGYIPWDDDIDLYMPRDSYERFISIYNKENNGTRVRTLFTDDQYYYSFAKVEDINTVLIEELPQKMDIGINIDIFPVDSVPNNNWKRKLYFFKNRIIRLIITAKFIDLNNIKLSKTNKLKYKILKYIFKNKDLRWCSKVLDASINKSNHDSLYVCNMTAGNGINSCFKRKAIENTIDIIFEKKTYKTMVGYDEYLRMTYGDYMQLPPIEKQVSHHHFKAFYK